MTKQICKEKKKNGDPCRYEALINGLCTIHYISYRNKLKLRKGRKR